MHLPFVLPWFLPLAVAVAYATTRMGVGLLRRERARRVDGILMLVLGWYPILMWVIAQFTNT